MKSKKRWLALMAQLQLFTSVLLAAAIVWGYVTYQASFGLFVQAFANSIGAISKVATRTAEIVESREGLLAQTGKMFAETRKLIDELRVATENQARSAPQYAEGVRSASSLAGKLSGAVQSIADTLLTIKIPTGVRWERLKPIAIMDRPLEQPAQALRANAQDLKVVSESLSGVANTIDHDGQKLSKAVIATSEQVLIVIAEAEKTLARLNTQDLPKALEELRTASKNLSVISAQVDIIGKIGFVFLIVGLILAVWCFLNSLGMLILTTSQGSDISSKTGC